MFVISAAQTISYGIPRYRLFESMDGLCRKTRVVWVSGPAGAGKTQLAAGYLKDRQIDSLWWRIDDNFVSHPGYPSPLSRNDFAALFEDILQKADRPTAAADSNAFALVFEDYQKLPPDCAFHEILAEGLNAFPPGVFLLILSRGQPPPGFVRLRAEGSIGFLGWPELRLCQEEADSLMRHSGHPLPDSVCLAELHTMTEGWAAGLVLLTEALQRGIQSKEGFETALSGSVFGYFEREVFDPLSPDRQLFLLSTAFLPEMSVRMAETVSKRGDANRVLADLQQAGAFIERRSGTPPVYGYHGLFRRFLAARAQERLSPAQIDELMRISAGLLEESGLIEAGAELYLKAGDLQALTRLIVRQAPEVIARGKGGCLEEWVPAACCADVPNTPEPLFWLGISRLPHDPAGGRNELEKAFAAASDSDAMKILSWSAIIDTFCLEWNDFTPLDHWIDWMEKALAAGLVFRDRAIEARAATAMSTALMLRQPGHGQTDSWVGRSLDLVHELPDVDSRVSKLTLLAFFYFWKGDLAHFRFVREEIESLVSGFEVSPLARLALPCIESFTAIWLEGSHETGLEKINQALQYAETTGVKAWNHMFLCLKAYCFLSRGDVNRAVHALREVSRLLDSSRKHLYCQYYYLLAWSSFLKDDKPLAKIQADTALVYAEQTGYVFPHILCLIENAWISHEVGEIEAAMSLLGRAKALSEETGSAMMDYSAALVEAGLRIAEGRESDGIRVFEDAMAIGREKGYMTPPWWCDPPFMAGLCARALSCDIETRHVTAFVYNQQMAIEPPAEGFFPEWPWPVRVFALGRFELLVWGKPVSFSGKVQKKPLEMLKALIALGGRNVSKARISDILWPDSDGDMAQQSFATTLHRLRQLLGDKQTIVLSEGRVSLNPRFVWVDALFLLKHAARLDSQWHLSSAPEMTREAQRLLDLYQGPFVDDGMAEAWAEAFQARMRRSCLGLFEHLGRYRQEREEWQAAASVYERAVDIDPLAEDFYLALMSCYEMLGRTGEVFRIYQQCRRNLEQALGSPPSPAIHDKLKAVLSQ